MLYVQPPNLYMTLDLLQKTDWKYEWNQYGSSSSAPKSEYQVTFGDLHIGNRYGMEALICWIRPDKSSHCIIICYEEIGNEREPAVN
jgi:hypothetical protein